MTDDGRGWSDSEYELMRLRDTESETVPIAPAEVKIEVNANGGKQSASEHFFRGLPTKALLWIARILKVGAATYEPDPFGDVSVRNWHRITSDEHLEHLMEHVVKYLDGDRSEDHVGHIGCRALFFVHMAAVEGKDPHAGGSTVPDRIGSSGCREAFPGPG